MPPKKFQYKEDENVVTIYHYNIGTILWYNRWFASSINVFCSELGHANLSTYRQRQPFYQCKNPTSDGDQQTISLNWMVATSVSLLVYAMILEFIIIWSIFIGSTSYSWWSWPIWSPVTKQKRKWENLKYKYKV